MVASSSIQLSRDVREIRQLNVLRTIRGNTVILILLSTRGIASC